MLDVTEHSGTKLHMIYHNAPSMVVLNALVKNTQRVFLGGS